MSTKHCCCQKKNKSVLSPVTVMRQHVNQSKLNRHSHPFILGKPTSNTITLYSLSLQQMITTRIHGLCVYHMVLCYAWHSGVVTQYFRHRIVTHIVTILDLSHILWVQSKMVAIYSLSEYKLISFSKKNTKIILFVLFQVCLK